MENTLQHVFKAFTYICNKCMDMMDNASHSKIEKIFCGLFQIAEYAIVCGILEYISSQVENPVSSFLIAGFVYVLYAFIHVKVVIICVYIYTSVVLVKNPLKEGAVSKILFALYLVFAGLGVILFSFVFHDSIEVIIEALHRGIGI
ncbi:MAG: hypothetical protein OXR68_03700 [Alphaproteobacteria bacterium]|nr:hypothetical protein [Alphaproteobacteria bacterium]MDD9919711.1 hypothetical protein [Alphaproteobacteria bacterium]